MDELKKISSEDVALMNEIIERAVKHNLVLNEDRLTLACDLHYAKSGDKKLDFRNLMSFDAENFAHDIVGISTHIHREQDEKMGEMKDCFEPRCGWKK